MNLQLSPTGRAYGAIRDVHDTRDYMLYPSDHKLLPMAPVIDLEEWLGPVKDQGNLGACTGFAYAGLREFLNRRYEHGSLVFSPLFIYYKEREMEGNISEDSGASSRSGCWVLAHQGACLETSDTYAPGRFREAPTVEQLSEATKYKVNAYHRIANLDDVKSCLRSGYACTMGIPVYESFESTDTGRTGIMTLPKNAEKLLGGHEVLCYGYDDQIKYLMFRNSWGVNWGRRGNFVMPYEFFNEFCAVIDVWMAHLGHKW